MVQRSKLTPTVLEREKFAIAADTATGEPQLRRSISYGPTEAELAGFSECKKCGEVYLGKGGKCRTCFAGCGEVPDEQRDRELIRQHAAKRAAEGFIYDLDEIDQAANAEPLGFLRDAIAGVLT